MMKISAVICTYNGEKYFEEQIISIINQSIKPNEIILCDDCSSDNTKVLLKKYADLFSDFLTVYYNEKQLGTIKNFEKAISLTTGNIIFLSDQDDIWYPDRLEKSLSVFNDQPNVLLLFSNGDLINENGNRTGSTLWDKWGFTPAIREKWRNNKLAFEDLCRNYNKVTGATIAFKKELIKHIIPIQVPYNYWHDAWFALHASALNGLYFIEESLIQYRIHSDQQIGLSINYKPSDNNLDFGQSVSYNEFLRYLKNKYPDLFPGKNWFLSFKKRIF